MKNRPRLWERITRLGVLRKDAWALLADSTDILHNGETSGGLSGEEFAFEHFLNMRKACNLVEMPGHGNGFT